MTGVCKWEGILDPHDISDECQAVIQKLLDGDSHGLKVEKLKGYDVYKVRINRGEERLLYKTITVNGEPYLLLLDVIRNHDYQKCRFLKPGVLRHHLEINGKAIVAQITERDFEPAELDTRLKHASKTTKTPSYQKMADCNVIEFFDQKYFLLDPNQLSTQKCGLPLLVSGDPGSGKTAILLKLLSQHVSLRAGEWPILFVAESEKLVELVQKSWQSLPQSQGLPPDAVQFKTYEALLISLQPSLSKCEVVPKAHCIEWLKIYIANYKSIARAIKKDIPESDELFKDHDLIYQEFRIVSGYTTLDDYKKLGKRQSLFQNEEHRGWIYAAYYRYLGELREQNKLHVPFYTLDLSNLFYRVVADEAQDLTYLQLKILLGLAIDQQICYCEDYRQSLSDNLSKVDFMEGLLRAWKKQASHIRLSVTYRCSQAVVRFANAILEMKSIVTQEGQPEIVSDQRESSGLVRWYDGLDDGELRYLQGEAQLPGVAVVTQDSNIERMKEKYKTNSVYGVNAKGLEFATIIVDGVFDSKEYEEINDILGTHSGTDSKKSNHRAKSNRGHGEFATSMNAIYVAFTRARGTLYFVQPNSHELRHILGRLKAAMTLEQPVSPVNQQSEDHDEQWFAEAKRQLFRGNDAYARQIFLEKLNRSGMDFQNFKIQFQQDGSVESSPQSSNNNNVPSALSVTNKASQSEKKNEKKNKNPNPVPNNVPGRLADPSEVAFLKAANNLLKNVTVSSLERFVNMGSSAEYLFTRKLPDGLCLFAKLTTQFSWQEVLFTVFRTRHHYLVNNLTIEALCQTYQYKHAAAGVKIVSPLFWFLANDSGRKIFNLMANKDMKKLAKIITPEALYQLDSDDTRWYPFLFLANTPEILQQVFLENRSLLDALKAEHLCDYAIDDKKDLLGEFVLGVLSVAVPKFVTSIFSESVDLKRETMRLIIDRANNDVRNKKPIIALIVFAFSAVGKDLVLEAVRKDVTWASQMEPGTLFSREFQGASLFFMFAITEGYFEILEILFNRNKNLITSISGDDLCCHHPRFSPVKMGNSTAFFHLATIREGQILLAKILRRNVSVAKKILASTLFDVIQSGTPGHNGSTAFYWLAGCMLGQEVLCELFFKNPDLIRQMTGKDLCYQYQSESSFYVDTVTPLYGLIKKSEQTPGVSLGWTLLRKLLKKNPDLINEITWELLSLKPVLKETNEPMPSALEYLLSNEEGRAILVLMQRNQLLRDKISLSIMIISASAGSGSSYNGLKMFDRSAPADREPHMDAKDDSGDRPAVAF